MPARHGEVDAAARPVRGGAPARTGSRAQGRQEVLQFPFAARRPNGTAVLRPTLQMGPDHRVHAIWAPTRALPRSGGSADDVPAEATDDPTPPWGPGGRTDYGPAGGHAGSDFPQRRWHGPDHWRNNWQDEPVEDGEPPAGTARRDVHRTHDPVPDSGEVAGIRQDDRPTAAAPPTDENWPGHGQTQDESYGDRAYRSQTQWDEGSPDRDSGDDAWRDDDATRAPAPAGSARGVPRQRRDASLLG